MEGATMNTAMWMRIAVLFVFLAGLTMFLNEVLGWGISSGFKNVLVLIHLVSAFGLVGLYEASLARKKRGMVVVAGKELSLAGRIFLTLALIMGLYILLGRVFDFISGDVYKTAIWLHAPVGLIAIGLAEVGISRLRVKSQ